MAQTDRKLWERQLDEPSKWYERFTFFRDLGPDRTLDQAFRNWWDFSQIQKQRVRHRPKRPPSSWYAIVRSWHWKDRADAWDDEQRRLIVTEQAEERKSMLKRHIEISMAVQRAAIQRLKDILDNNKLTELSARDVVAYLDKGISLERQARGFPDEVLEFWSLTDDELVDKYAQLYQQLEASGGAGEYYEDEGSSDTGEDHAQPGDEEV